ncbi:MAG: hypothetical protein FWE01_01475 [Firmicutes bacterium]|nr:hypothetical protein [Bacillota bacterium]
MNKVFKRMRVAVAFCAMFAFAITGALVFIQNGKSNDGTTVEAAREVNLRQNHVVGQGALGFNGLGTHSIGHTANPIGGNYNLRQRGPENRNQINDNATAPISYTSFQSLQRDGSSGYTDRHATLQEHITIGGDLQDALRNSGQIQSLSFEFFFGIGVLADASRDWLPGGANAAGSTISLIDLNFNQVMDTRIHRVDQNRGHNLRSTANGDGTGSGGFNDNWADSLPRSNDGSIMGAGTIASGPRGVLQSGQTARSIGITSGLTGSRNSFDGSNNSWQFRTQTLAISPSDFAQIADNGGLWLRLFGATSTWWSSRWTQVAIVLEGVRINAVETPTDGSRYLYNSGVRAAVAEANDSRYVGHGGLINYRVAFAPDSSNTGNDGTVTFLNNGNTVNHFHSVWGTTRANNSIWSQGIDGVGGHGNVNNTATNAGNAIIGVSTTGAVATTGTTMDRIIIDLGEVRTVTGLGLHNRTSTSDGRITRAQIWTLCETRDAASIAINSTYMRADFNAASSVWTNQTPADIVWTAGTDNNERTAFIEPVRTRFIALRIRQLSSNHMMIRNLRVFSDGEITVTTPNITGGQWNASNPLRGAGFFFSTTQVNGRIGQEFNPAGLLQQLGIQPFTPSVAGATNLTHYVGGGRFVTFPMNVARGVGAIATNLEFHQELDRLTITNRTMSIDNDQMVQYAISRYNNWSNLNWQTSPVFDDLRVNENYYVFVRTLENDEFEAGVYANNGFAISTIAPSLMPSNLEGRINDTLGSIILPNGWAWVNNDDILTLVGSTAFDAIYTPSNTNIRPRTFTLTINVLRATPNYTIPTGINATFGQRLIDIEAQLPSGWAWVTPTASVGNAGVNNHQAIYTPSDLVNYYPVTRTIQITVAQVKPPYIIPTGISVQYGTMLSEITLSPGWTFVNPNQSVGGVISSRLFLARFTPLDGNFLTIERNISIAVTPAALEYQTPEPITYEISAGLVLGDIELPDGWVWQNENQILSVGTHSFYADLEQSLSINFVTVSRLVSVTITRATPSYTPPVIANQTFEQGRLVGSIALGDGWQWENVNLPVGNVGTNSFWAIYTPSDIENFTTVRIQIEIYVRPAISTVVAPSFEVMVGTYLREIELDTGWTWINPNRNVGDATTTPRGFAATFISPCGNYLPATRNIMITVLPMIINDYTPPDAITYTFKDGLTLEDIAHLLPSEWQWAEYTQLLLDAGTHIIYAELVKSLGINYVTVRVPVTITINQATPDIVSPTFQPVLEGTELERIKLAKGWELVSSNRTLRIGLETFEIRFTPSNANFAPVTFSVTVLVFPSFPTTLTADFNTTLGQLEHLINGWIWFAGNDQLVGNVGAHTFRITFTYAGETVVREIQITVKQIEPGYDLPVLEDPVEFGTMLYTVKLPEGWEWKDGDQQVGNIGTNYFYAIYTPKDTHNFTTVTRRIYVNVTYADPNVNTPTIAPVITGTMISDIASGIGGGWSLDEQDRAIGNPGIRTFLIRFDSTESGFGSIREREVSVFVYPTLPLMPSTVEYNTTLGQINLTNGWTWVAGNAQAVGNVGIMRVFLIRFSHTDINDTFHEVIRRVYLDIIPTDPTDFVIPTPVSRIFTQGLMLHTIELGINWTWVANDQELDASTHTFYAVYNRGSNFNPITRPVTFTITKAIPEYTIPSITSQAFHTGRLLSAITLPNGWTWENAGLQVGTVGTRQFFAIFNSGNANFETVRRQITITVTPVDFAFDVDFKQIYNTITLTVLSNNTGGELEFQVVGYGQTVNDDNWTTNLVFENLTAPTMYRIFVRRMADANNTAGQYRNMGEIATAVASSSNGGMSTGAMAGVATAGAAGVAGAACYPLKKIFGRRRAF